MTADPDIPWYVWTLGALAWVMILGAFIVRD